MNNPLVPESTASEPMRLSAAGEIRRLRMRSEVAGEIRQLRQRSRARRTAVFSATAAIALSALFTWVAVRDAHRRTPAADLDSARQIAVTTQRAPAHTGPTAEIEETSPPRFERIDDEELLQWLREAGQPSYLARIDGRLLVIRKDQPF